MARPQVPIAAVDVAAYTIPTATPESDGTLEWRATTLVVAEARAGDWKGLGYSYADTATATLVRDRLAALVVGRDALATTDCWNVMVREIRNLGRPGVASMAISAVDNALWDLKGQILDVPLVSLLGDASIEAMVDANALEQAIGHLLQNALDASSGEPVTVRVGRDPGRVSIAIADKGVGMDGDFIRNRLFQPFASTKPGGFGIGAFEARSLVAAMGGRISVDSRPGRGTTFTILLPAAGAAAEPERKIA